MVIDVRSGLSGTAGADARDWLARFAPAADRARLAGYADALAFYQGEQRLGRRRRGEARLTFNYARTLVRKIASYVFPAPVTFSVTASRGVGESESRAEAERPRSSRLPDSPTSRLAEAANRAERVLAETIADLDLAQLDIELCVDASVLGDGALKVTWDGLRRRPVVVAVDPASLFAWWAPDDPQQVERVAQVYQLSGAAVARLFGTWPP